MGLSKESQGIANTDAHEIVLSATHVQPIAFRTVFFFVFDMMYYSPCIQNETVDVSLSNRIIDCQSLMNHCRRNNQIEQITHTEKRGMQC